MLTLGWLGVQRVRIQRRRCKVCGYEIPSAERLSVRKIQLLVGFVYARQVSIGYIERLTQRVGKRAEAALARLSDCRQAKALFLLYDETYPKMKKRMYSLGVAICEHGLIRSVRCIVRKAKDIPTQLRDVVGTHFQPQYFLTDLDVLFNKYMKDAGLKLTHLRDRVHLIRQIVRLFDDAVRNVTLDVPKRLPFKERKKQRQLKRRLLRKRLQPMLSLVFKAFSSGYESICVLILEGVVSQLRDPAYIIQTTSVQTLARRLQRLINKHGETINISLQLAVEQGTPTTTNALESKNGIFKPFSLSRHAAPTKVPVLCNEPRSTWMTWALQTSSQQSACQSHKYLWPLSRIREPSLPLALIKSGIWNWASRRPSCSPPMARSKGSKAWISWRSWLPRRANRSATTSS
jgi:hypothetical protein